MVNGVIGLSPVVARPVVKEARNEPVPAPTPHLQEAERTVRGKTKKPKNVNLENAKVWILSILI